MHTKQNYGSAGITFPKALSVYFIQPCDFDLFTFLTGWSYSLHLYHQHKLLQEAGRQLHWKAQHHNWASLLS